MVKKEKKRGVWLTIWLTFMLIGNLFIALIYLLLSKTVVAPAYPNVALWVWYMYGLLTLENFVFVIFLFMWKKWPFFALCGMAMVAFILNLVIGLGILDSILGFLGPLILYLSMKSRWDLFE